MLRIISANLNGIRSAAKKGFMGWLNDQSADFICVQELKAQQADLDPEILSPPGLQAYFHHAEKKGYSGSGIFTPHPVKHVQLGFGNPEFDAEGRYVEVQIGQLSVISVYMPSGSSSPERQEAKFFFWMLSSASYPLKKSGAKFCCVVISIFPSRNSLKNWER